MLKKAILFIFLGIIVLAVIAGLIFWNAVSLPVSSSSEQVLFSITKGQGVKQIASELANKKLIRSPKWMEAYVYLDGTSSKFIAGDYYLLKNMNIREVVKVLTGGVSAPEQNITIKEGWAIKDIADYLDTKGLVSKADFTTAANVADSHSIIPEKSYPFLAGRPANQGLEGFLFPDTYRVFDKTTAANIIEKMLDNFNTKYTDQMRADTVQGNLTIYQVVTLASILEKEITIARDASGNPTNNDLNIAAGVFYNRLNNGIALQSDATLVYATGKNPTQLTNDDKNYDSPYNTYKYPGLPSGPICNPSIDSIRAAIYPAKTDYYYFLTKLDGTTVFSKTYEEHLTNKQKYLK